MPEAKTVSLSRESASYVDRMIAEGRFASEAEVVEAGLHALQDHDEELERWLREEVVPAARELDEHPEIGLSRADVELALFGKSLPGMSF